MEEILSEFSSLLKERLSKKIYTTEDSVRYTFFAALLMKTNIAPHEIILEYPHLKIRGATVDTYILSSSGRKGLVIEFKYDRRIPSRRNAPKSQKAGKLFYDIYKLIQFYIHDSKPVLWFIYLTDAEMIGYLRNKRNGLIDFFDLQTGKVLEINKEYIYSKTKTFQRAVGAVFSAKIKCVWKEEMPNEHEVRVYEILPHSKI